MGEEEGRRKEQNAMIQRVLDGRAGFSVEHIVQTCEFLQLYALADAFAEDVSRFIEAIECDERRELVEEKLVCSLLGKGGQPRGASSALEVPSVKS